MLCLGSVAHDAAWRVLGIAKPPAFRHGAVHLRADGPVMMDSYHVSQQNTATGRLTAAMFDAVLAAASAAAELSP